jgi:MFS transporter, DHA1 family, multidrug resistance protein
VFPIVQGFGGGLAAVVARAVVVDVAKGDQLARVMSILMALGGLAPMVAPVFGGAVLTLGGTWRTVFWCLVGFGLLMMIAATRALPWPSPTLTMDYAVPGRSAPQLTAPWATRTR